MAATARYLDELDGTARIRQVRGLSRREQARLFDAAEGARPVSLVDLVPADVPPLAEVIHHGRNSLPVFRTFEKRLCRPPGDASVLWGYNEHGLRWVTGPGYFVARDPGNGEVLLDYLEVPPDRPEGWPAVKPNSAGPSRFVYHRLQDVVRGVSRSVFVGRAAREGRPIDNWFVLCRGGTR